MLVKFVEISITLGIIIMALMLLFPVLNKRFSAKWRYWIWLILCIRLILPFNINLSKPLLILKPSVLVQETSMNFDNLKTNENIYSAIVKDFDRTILESVPENKIDAYSGFSTIYIIWITISIGIIAYRFAGYFIFRKSLLRWSISSGSLEIEKTLREIRNEMMLKSDIMLIISEKAPSPMVLGFIKPLLVLPNNQYNTQDLKIILRHELIHVKRRDVWYKLLMAIAVSIHWFNPIVYLMEKSANRDLEISCDEELVDGKSMKYRKEYSEAILRAIDFQKVNNCAFINYWGGKKIMKQRIKNILNQNKKRKGIVTASVILLTIAISGSLVACSSGQSNLVSSSISDFEKENSTLDRTVHGIVAKPKEGPKYQTEADFLNSPEGVKFQQVAYKGAKAYLSGNLNQVSKYFIDPKDASVVTENVFNNLDYMILKWRLSDIKSEDEILASYEYKLNGKDSVSYVIMEMKKVNNNWKIKSIGEQK